MQNRYQARTSPVKLQGQYYTPEALVAMILEALSPGPSCLVIDPACGDGRFLCGAVAALARHGHVGRLGKCPTAWAGRIVGFDADPTAVRAARAALQEAFHTHMGVDLPPGAIRVGHADPLREPSLPALLEAAGASQPEPGTRLFVVGNPPYVEAKRLPRELKSALRERHAGAIGGAPDLYLYFLHVCLGWLRPEDRLAFVLPNKLLVNTNARALRETLLDGGWLRALWLATRTGAFPGAAVYPIVLFAGGSRPGGRPIDSAGAGGPAAADAPRSSIAVTHIARSRSGDLFRLGEIAVPAALYRATAARAFFPPPESAAGRSALERLLQLPPESRLDAHLDVRWSVSFHRAGLRERYVTGTRPASPHARPFLGGGAFAGNGEVARYRACWEGGWIDYDRDRLRAEGNSVPPLQTFEQPKIIICQNGRTLRAAYDADGYVLKDTFLCGLLRRPDHPLGCHPRALVGLLCSRAVHFFYAHVFYGGHVNGGYLHFLRSFLVDVPVGSWSEEEAAETARLGAIREQAAPAEWEALEEAIETHVAAALGLTPEEQAAIREWAAEDENWRARERVRGPRGRECETTRA
jgi:hypothetical protein